MPDDGQSEIEDDESLAGQALLTSFEETRAQHRTWVRSQIRGLGLGLTVVAGGFAVGLRSSNAGLLLAVPFGIILLAFYQLHTYGKMLKLEGYGRYVEEQINDRTEPQLLQMEREDLDDSPIFFGETRYNLITFMPVLLPVPFMALVTWIAFTRWTWIPPALEGFLSLESLKTGYVIAEASLTIVFFWGLFAERKTWEDVKDGAWDSYENAEAPAPKQEQAGTDA